MECPDEADLTGFLRRELRPEHARTLEHHFGDCDACRQLVFALATDSTVDRQDTAPGVDARPREGVLAAGDTLGRFIIEGEIASGGMGVIYRAHDPTLKRSVALKLLKVGAVQGPDRLLREAHALAQLEHPNIVTVFEAGLLDGEVFIAMELIDGVSLDTWLARSRTWRAIANVLEAAGRGLAAAHAAGLVHRDVKPSNIMIASDGRVKVVDFGLARAIEASSSTSFPSVTGTNGGDRLTRTGALVGTPAYSAPEQLAGGEVDPASDTFSYCVTFVEALFGSRPFLGVTTGALLECMLAGSPTVPAKPRIPSRLRAVLRRGLAFDPSERASLGEVLDVLAREPGRQRVRTRLIGATTIAGVAALVTVAVQRPADSACTTSRAEIETVWNPDRAARVRDAILATKAPFAVDSWQRIERSLDQYADRWVAMSTRACEATAVHRTQSAELLDRRMTCLAQRRADLDATLTTLAETDERKVREALRAVSRMPSLATCDDTQGLLALEAPPDDPVRSAQLNTVRAEISRAAALDRAGELEPGLALARSATKKATDLAYKPALADALYTRGRIEATLHLPEYRESYEGAIMAAAASGHREVEARALAGLSMHLNGVSSDGRVARAHAGHAVAIADGIPTNPLLQAETRYANAHVQIGIDQAAFLANMELGQRRLDAAAQLDPDAVELLRIAYEELLVNVEPIGGTALPKLVALLARAEKIYGRDHPALVDTLETMVGYAVDANNFADARAYAARISKLLARYPGRETAMLRIDAHLESDPDRRRTMREQIVKDTELSSGPFSPKVASALDDLAEDLFDRGAYKEAAPVIDRAVAIWEASYSHNHEVIIVSLVLKGQIYAQLGDLETATAVADHATRIATRNNVRDVTKVLAGLLLADLHFQQKRFAAAIALFDTHAPMVRRMLEGDPSLVLIDFYIAACEWELQRGDRRQAMQRARTARDAYTATFQPEQASLDVMKRWFDSHR